MERFWSREIGSLFADAGSPKTSRFAMARTQRLTLRTEAAASQAERQMHWSFTEVVENATEKLLRDWEGEMPIFLDRHDMSGLTAADIAEAHRKDLEIQADYGVNFITYWFDESRGSGFCLIDAPDKETAMRVHEEAHGDVALDVIDVDLSAVQAFLGRIADPELAEEEHLIEPAFRSVMFTDLVDSTAMTAQLGDKRSLEIVRSHDSIVRSSLRSTGGREVKHTGDGIMAAFDDATLDP